MKHDRLNELFSNENKVYDSFISPFIAAIKKLKIYPRSINFLENHYFFIARSGNEKNLYIIFYKNNDSLACKFNGGLKKSDRIESEVFMKFCPLNHENALAIQELFDFIKPVLIGTENSFGFGDRLGLANPGHVQAVAGSNVKPVFAQQSIRELERTGRRPEDVMDAAVWAVFQEGYKEGFGSDADHLKTTEDIDRMARAGFTMFTFDPGDYVVNNTEKLPIDELYDMAQKLPWDKLEDTFEDFIGRYENYCFTITEDFILQPGREELLRGIVKYGNVIAHTTRLYRHLKVNYSDHPCEVELSVDETDSPTSPFEHFLIANELKRLEIRLVSLAPRFIGDFEKGIDYKGDIELFREEYDKHLKIARSLGPYKISLHSGSDKFSIYNVIGQFKEGLFHIKTAGTSYLVALQTVACKDPALFREILNYSREYYETEKESYHVSADIVNVPSAENFTDKQLMELFEQNDARQVLHVTFGKVLTTKISETCYLFRDRLLECLNENEDTHYKFLKRHFHSHIKAFL